MVTDESECLTVKIGGEVVNLTSHQTSVMKSRSVFFKTATSGAWARPEGAPIDIGQDFDKLDFEYLLNEMVNDDATDLFDYIEDDMKFARMYELVLFLDIPEVDLSQLYKKYMHCDSVIYNNPDPMAVMKMHLCCKDKAFQDLAERMAMRIVKDPRFQSSCMSGTFLSDTAIQASLTDHCLDDLEQGRTPSERQHTNIEGEGLFFLGYDKDRNVVFLHYSVDKDSWKVLEPPALNQDFSHLTMIVHCKTVYVVQKRQLEILQDNTINLDPETNLFSYDIDNNTWKSLQPPDSQCIVLPYGTELVAIPEGCLCRRQAHKDDYRCQIFTDQHWTYCCFSDLQNSRDSILEDLNYDNYDVMYTDMREKLIIQNFDATYLRFHNKSFAFSKGRLYMKQGFNEDGTPDVWCWKREEKSKKVKSKRLSSPPTTINCNRQGDIYYMIGVNTTL